LWYYLSGKRYIPIKNNVIKELKKRYFSASSPYREGIIFLPLELQEIVIKQEKIMTRDDTLNPDEIRKEASRKIKARIKSYDRIIEKIKRRNIVAGTTNTLERKIGDIVGTRIVVDYLQQVYATLAVIKTHRRFKILEIEDFIEKPQDSGYRGIHVKIRFDTPNFKGVICEIQIKTQTQDSWAEKTHDLVYKAEETTDAWKFFAKKQSDCLNNTDESFEVIKKEIVQMRQPTIKKR
jgi:ppGpp synthetase/RelA/SpoT-type nucleotidyltranferase